MILIITVNPFKVTIKTNNDTTVLVTIKREHTAFVLDIIVQQVGNLNLKPIKRIFINGITIKTRIKGIKVGSSRVNNYAKLGIRESSVLIILIIIIIYIYSYNCY